MRRRRPASANEPASTTRTKHTSWISEAEVGDVDTASTLHGPVLGYKLRNGGLPYKDRGEEIVSPRHTKTQWRYIVQGLKFAIRVLCVLAFITGIVDMFAGVQLLIFGGGRLASVAADPVLNSQVGFWGAIWFGFGVVLWRTSSRLRAEPDLFRILCGITALSGFARLGAAIVYGLPGPVLTVAMIVEIGAGVGLYLWHAAALNERADARAHAA